MDTLTLLNAGLAGFFAFAAIHYAVNWWGSRDERVLLVFSVQCALYAAFCGAIASYFRARTIPDTQSALNRFVTIGVLAHPLVIQFYEKVGHRRDRVLRVLVTGTCVFLAVLNQWAPLRGTVVALKTMPLPGGGTATLPIRTPPGVSLVVLYLVVLAVDGYGLFIARATWKRDRVGGSILAVAAAVVLAGSALGFLIDFANVRAPYTGAWPHAVFVLCMALYLSREYAARGARLAASERRAEHSLQEARETLADLEAEQRRREEAEAARHCAMEALVQAQRTELASHLAAGVAHDFNNVLNVISLWSGLLLDGAVSATEREKAGEALAVAQAQAQALSRQLMAVARPETRAVKRFPLDRPIRTAVQTLTPVMPRTVELGFAAAATPEVEADETEIQQVIYNLVLNARDAMPAGGAIQVIAGLETSPIPIAVIGGSLAAGRWATLSVADSGPGVDPALRERIFELFFSTKGERGGTGLGLATVVRIAKAHAGGVALESAPGRGATFKLYLPCA